ncbi:hypothetical protein AB0F30_05095 [Streptomyces sp. NPDC029006]|uniref:hypothetical protein n=1 Tax=Streptomyces sp. NPDC029006 TaxID=3155467 RepID=UPI0033D9B768
MKTVAEAKTAKAARMKVPIRASLELYRGGSRVEVARLGGLALTHRVLEKDLEALGRVVAPRQDAPDITRGPRGGTPADSGMWRAAGVRLPMETQVNGFQGAPRVRELVASAIRAAVTGSGTRGRPPRTPCTRRSPPSG